MLPLKDNVPTRTFPIVTVGIIVVNVIVWFWEVTGTPVDEDVIHYGYYPCKLDAPCTGPALHAQIPWYENTFTSMFMHGGWAHIGFNVLFLCLWFLFQLWQGGFSLVQPQAGGGVAFFAHIGGFLFGVLTVHFVAKRRPLMPTY